jgi:alkanesulfonate monooxygenase SsuD/methylene tetrahydromethanopterin reductase-like flavin-dependent oxidoreductase (luciferase family)
MKVGVLHVPTSAVRAGALAQQAEAAGVGWFGVADSPVIFGALYPTIQHVLAVTSAIRVGPLVTNPVTRHRSVHASTFRALEELHPGRTFFGISAGDSAVHSIGLEPGSPAQVAATVEAVREAVGPELPIITAVGGPKAAAGIAPASTGVLLGTGLDAAALDDLARLAGAGPGSARTRWLYAVCHLVDHPHEVPAARVAIRAPVMSFSRHALSGRMERRHVPGELVDGLTQLYARYDYSQHSRLGSTNARLLEGREQEEDYLLRRFALVGTPAAAAAALARVAAEAGEFGIFLSTAVPDPSRHVALVGRLIDHLAGRSHVVA